MALQTVLIKPASGLCNISCDYCFYCDETAKRTTASFGMMTEETLENIIRKVLRQAEGEVCFAFQGGEPTLRGLDFFRRAVELEKQWNIRNVPIKNALQTNGYTLDETWCRFFRENGFLIGVSVDGTQEIHNRWRHGANGGDSFQKIEKTINLMEQWKVEYNILTVVTRQTAENIRDIYQSYKKKGWNYQQYIACLDPIGETAGQRPYSLTPSVYGKFLTELFRLWQKDWRKGKAPYIRQFENYIGILQGYPPEACEQSGRCSVQCVAEADGSAYPCDFYVLDEYYLGNYNTGSIRGFYKNPVAEKFVKESTEYSKDCLSCPYLQLCRNGCRRHRIQTDDGKWKNYFCDSYQSFFEKCLPELIAIARYGNS